MDNNLIDKIFYCGLCGFYTLLEDAIEDQFQGAHCKNCGYTCSREVSKETSEYQNQIKILKYISKSYGKTNYNNKK